MIFFCGIFLSINTDLPTLMCRPRDNKLKRRYIRGISGMNLRNVNARTSHPRISPMLVIPLGPYIYALSPLSIDIGLAISITSLL
jgi:hypothetical protein